MSDGKKKKRKCIVCLSSESKICFVPCGHVVACNECAEILKSREDPCVICRSPITTFVTPIYL